MKYRKVTISPNEALRLMEEYKDNLLNKNVPLRLDRIQFLQTLQLISEGKSVYILDPKKAVDGVIE